MDSPSSPSTEPPQHRRRRRPIKNAARLLVYLFARVVHIVIERLPLPVGLLLARLVGRVMYVFSVSTTRTAIENLTAAFGQGQSPREIRRLARQVYQHGAATVIEFCILRKWSTERLAAAFPEALENLRKFEREVTAEGRGAVGITAHVGNWEVLALLMQRFAPGLMVTIAKRSYNERVQRILDRVRTEDGMEVIYTDEAPRRIFRAVLKGHLIGMLPDQSVRTNSGLFVDFFGRPAWTATFPIDLARRARVPVVFVFLVRADPSLRRSGYSFVQKPSFEPTVTGDDEADQLEGTERWSAVVESVIRDHPSQWAWAHSRWKNQPGNPRLARPSRASRRT